MPWYVLYRILLLFRRYVLEKINVVSMKFVVLIVWVMMVLNIHPPRGSRNIAVITTNEFYLLLNPRLNKSIFDIRYV